MPAETGRLFLPGLGARSTLYRSGLPDGWTSLDPPGFGATGGDWLAYRRWIVDELDRRARPVELAGHSMGGALAIAAAAARPDVVRRLLLISPAGLPLAKPMRKSLADFLRQAVRGRYPLPELLRSLAAVAAAPADALRLAQCVRALDLSEEMELVRRASIPVSVIGCASDTLVTPDHCRRTARRLGGTFRELQLDGGHMWMLRAWPPFERVLATP